ncbi:579_t:CDS:1, partial [Gigaspora margarita]
IGVGEGAVIGIALGGPSGTVVSVGASIETLYRAVIATIG